MTNTQRSNERRPPDGVNDRGQAHISTKLQRIAELARDKPQDGEDDQELQARICLRGVCVVYGKNSDGRSLLDELDNTRFQKGSPQFFPVSLQFWDYIGGRAGRGSGATRNVVVGLNFPGNVRGLSRVGRDVRSVHLAASQSTLNEFNVGSRNAVRSAADNFWHELAHSVGFSHNNGTRDRGDDRTGKPDFERDAGPLKMELLDDFFERLGKLTPQ